MKWNKISISDDKIKNYLLNMSHPIGQSKAVFFLSQGYSVDKVEIFKNDLLSIVSEENIENTFDIRYGTKYIINGNIKSPSKRLFRVRSVWVVEKNSDILRLVTAYPL